MSLYGALMTGVSSLDANSRALSITSSNIANVNTVGYKASTAAFSTFLATSASGVAPSSVTVNSEQQIQDQGLLQTTGSSTDLAVSGQGFFIVTENPATPTSMLYTRAGSFTPDANGFLRNSAGYYLEGWTLNSDGSMPANRSTLSAIDLSSLNGIAKATEAITLKANLQSSATPVSSYTAGDITSGAVTPQFEQTIDVYDSQGGARPMKFSFVKTDANTWNYEIAYQGPAADIGGAGNNPVGTGSVTFNSDGTLATPAGGIGNFTIPWDASSGLEPQSVSVNFGTVGESNGVAQFDNPSGLTSATVDGAPYGSLSNVSVDDQGFVTALFDNGIQKKVFKIPLANFANPNGLSAIAGNAYQTTDESGGANVLEPKTGGVGAISSSSLESSTADLAKEFSDLITTQRAYSAATRIITTADQMLQELMQIKQ